MADITMIEDAGDRAIAEWLQACLGTALDNAPGGIAITMPGGSTPFPILAELVTMPLNFARIAVWPGDDRIVAEDHPASNVGRIRALLEPVGARIVPLQLDARPPHFALAWLGMGGDGHIASLFPNTDPRADDPLAIRRLTPDPLPPEAPFDRITLTIPALLASDQLLFVARGAEKRACVRTGRRRRRPAGRPAAGRRSPAGDVLHLILQRLLPARAHRIGLRMAHELRIRWWRVRRPRLTGCRVVAVNAAQEVLLIRHSYGSPVWMLPGGGVGRGETPIAAARRELAEETGCRLARARYVAMTREVWHGALNEVHVIAGCTADSPVVDAREIMEARFFALDALPMDIGKSLPQYLPVWLKG